MSSHLSLHNCPSMFRPSRLWLSISHRSPFIDAHPIQTQCKVPTSALLTVITIKCVDTIETAHSMSSTAMHCPQSLSDCRAIPDVPLLCNQESWSTRPSPLLSDAIAHNPSKKQHHIYRYQKRTWSVSSSTIAPKHLHPLRMVQLSPQHPICCAAHRYPSLDSCMVVIYVLISVCWYLI